MISTVAKIRPELFFRLADDLPSIKDRMFAIAGSDKEIRRILKNTESNSVSKKEFLKERKQITGTIVWTMCVYAIRAGFGIYALIR